jgi:hypothetical protein
MYSINNKELYNYKEKNIRNLQKFFSYRQSIEQHTLQENQ